MKAQMKHLGEALREGFWFVPTMMTVAAVALAALSLWADSAIDPSGLPAWLQPLMYAGEPDGAREVLSTIASSMITVAGVVFSITIVALTLTSGQFGPWLLANFIRDRGNQITLGTFIATFLYSLLVLRTISGVSSEDVPQISVTLALVFAIGGLAVLIYFIHHISTSIQAPELIASIGRRLRIQTERLFPSGQDAKDEQDAQDAQDGPLPPECEAVPCPIGADASGYVQIIDMAVLLKLAAENGVVVRVLTRTGRFVVRGSAIAHVWPAGRVDDRTVRQIASTVVTSTRRTDIADVEFPIKQLVVIAVRALSPGINDPFTANNCIDELSVGLCELAARPMPPVYRRGASGEVRIVAGDALTFERLVGAAYDQIRQSASDHVSVYLHVLTALAQIACFVRTPDRLEPLLKEGRLTYEAARASVPNPTDVAVIRGKYVELRSAAGSSRDGFNC